MRSVLDACACDGGMCSGWTGQHQGWGTLCACIQGKQDAGCSGSLSHSCLLAVAMPPAADIRWRDNSNAQNPEALAHRKKVKSGNSFQ